MSFADRLIAHYERRAPDFVIGGADRPYLRRWFVIPRNPVCNVYLHQILRSDDDRAHHTHPWLFNVSWLLAGLRYLEHTRAGAKWLFVGSLRFRWGAAPHRIEVQNPVWTLFITGPRVREWGFLCPRGFVHWRVFTAADDKGAIGRGCEE